MTTTPTSHRDLETLKRGQSLADLVVASGVSLVPAGPRRLKGHCPFHADRDPSFFVFADDEHFHCFGCGSHGDVIDFVMRREGLDFAAACRRLFGLAPSSPRPPTPSHTPVRERHWDRLTLGEQLVMNTALAVYQHALWRMPRALAYARSRGLPDWAIRACGLGYADGHSLELELRRHGGLRPAEELGLLRPPGRVAGAHPARETLAGRLVVPELRRGQASWFIGRSLVERPDSPKYLALPGERPVLGYERAAGAREAFLCEGVFDFLTAVSWRLPAFSLCGTHLPSERLGFLARARLVYGALDGDAAGRAAALRFAEQLGPRWRPLALPDGCDLNDLGRRPDGRALFFGLLAAARRGRAEGAAHGR